MSSIQLGLVIPCFNEVNNLPLLVQRCVSLTEACNAEVIFVDNGSTDKTPEVLSALISKYGRLRSVRVEVNQGYGFGILAGLHATSGEILAWTHADMQADPMDAAFGLKLFEKSAHPRDLFVKGRRYGRPFGDIVFTIGMSAFETLLLRRAMWDINAQPTMCHRSVFEQWCEPPHDFSLDLYAYFQARRKRLVVKRFPVLFGERAHGVSRWNVS